LEDGRGEAFWRGRAEQLQHALTSRIVVEQAKGVLAERLALDMEGSFDVLRSAARSTQTKLQELAAEVVESKETPPSIVRAFARHGSFLSQEARAHKVPPTQRFFRAINDEIGRVDGEQTDYVCECGNPVCAAPIVLSAEILVRLHAEPDLFVVSPGHEIADVELVVERGEGFVIIRRDG
jgi:hypothetical protein